MTDLRIEIDGRRVGAEELWTTSSAFGHFTAMQVRGGRTRGLGFHLARLEAANRELFGARLDGERVRELVRHALADVEDASVRVYVYESGDEPALMVTVRAPQEAASPQGLQSVRYQRPQAHLKHLATGQAYYGRLARLNRFDDALLTGADGDVAETTIANIGFFEDGCVVWPDAPHLHGITMQVLEQRLPELGVPSRRARVRLADIASFRGAFLSNSRGIAAVDRIDETPVPVDTERLQAVLDAYASAPWDPI